MDLYADNILDHYKHPHHKEMMNDATVTHAEKNLSCGDTITLMLKINDDRVADVRWQGEGCAISQAAMSILSDELIGKTLSELDAITPEQIKAMIGIEVGNRRIKCALLCLHTLKNALHAYRKEPQQGWMETVGNAD